MADLKELEDRIGRIEQEIFGFTFKEASEYLHRINENLRRMGNAEQDRFFSTNLETMQKAEKCVGA